MRILLLTRVPAPPVPLEVIGWPNKFNRSRAVLMSLVRSAYLKFAAFRSFSLNSLSPAWIEVVWFFVAGWCGRRGRGRLPGLGTAPSLVPRSAGFAWARNALRCCGLSRGRVARSALARARGALRCGGLSRWPVGCSALLPWPAGGRRRLPPVRGQRVAAALVTVARARSAMRCCCLSRCRVAQRLRRSRARGALRCGVLSRPVGVSVLLLWRLPPARAQLVAAAPVAAAQMARGMRIAAAAWPVFVAWGRCV